MTIYELLQNQKGFVHVAAAGAGSTLITDLWSEPGASEWLSGGTFIYADQEMEDFLGFWPDWGTVNQTTSIFMAMAAYRKAFRALPKGRKPIGVGVTASVASNRIHRGNHRFFATVLTDTHCAVLAHEPMKKGEGRWQRNLDEDIVCQETLSMLARSDGWKWCIEPNALLDSAIDFIHCQPKGVGWSDYILYPGAFNPLHRGHERLAEKVSQMTGKPVLYHVNTHSPHKPPLTAQDVLKRTVNFPFVVSRDCPLYIDKARQHRGVPMIIGTDALERMLDPKWGPDVNEMLQEFKQLGTKFYVGERIIDGKVLSLQEVLQKCLGVENHPVFIYAGVSGPESSTAIREQNS